MSRPVDDIFPEARREQSIEHDLCAMPPFGCGGEAEEFRDEQSRREYNISGLCQDCQDDFFGV